MKSLLWFFLIFTLCKVSVAEESYCEISKYFNQCSNGDVILLEEKSYTNSLSLENKIAEYCSFDHEIIELTDKYLNNPKFLCIFKEQKLIYP